MSTEKTKRDGVEDLHQRARIRAGVPEGIDRRESLSPDAARQTLHELRVHQVELETQNEELRRTQFDLDAARSRYFDLYDLAPVGYCTVSETESILEANLTAAHLLGIVCSDLVGRPIQQFILPSDQDIYYLHRKRLFETGQPQSCELRLLKRDGSSFWAQLTATHTLDETGSKAHRLVLTDISVRKHLDQALNDKNEELLRATRVAEKANQAKSEFLSSMSHELRSPLNAILGFAQLLESGKPPPTVQQAQNIEKILSGGWYLLTLINEILDLALIESGKLALTLGTVSLPSVLLECQEMIEPLAQQRGIRTSFPVSAAPCLVVADAIRLKQVIVNLLSNAVKYNRPNGSVEVTVRETALGVVRISVLDTGEGLAADKLSELFQTFNRLGQEGSTTEGTGIGLVVTQRLTALMGGSIGVQSTVGVGSVFWVEFARAKETPQLRSADPGLAQVPLPPASPHHKICTVLYVEDNPINRELVAQILISRPHITLLHAIDGAQGIRMARQHLPQVILMDINLPDINGVEALSILRKDAATRHIPILAISANAMPLDVVKGLAAGFFRYLTKPIRIKEFLEAVDVACAFAQDAPG